MLRYITRRLLQMIVTVFGVILITFILFNISGGDPAIMKFGQKGRPKQLEDYDIERGYNKPKFFGAWGGTRAFQKSDFSANAGAWSSVAGVAYSNRPTGRIVLAGVRDYAIPMALPLYTNSNYRWVFKYRTSGRADGRVQLLTFDGSNTVSAADIRPSEYWRTYRHEFATAGEEQALSFRLAVTNCTLEIRYARLDRKVGHVLDSQFLFTLRQIVTFDFGRSVETNQDVGKMILDGILPSLSLTVPMFLLAVIVEIVLALVCAYFRNTFIDRFFVVISVAMMSIPYIVWIIFGQYFFGYAHRWFPVWGYESAKYLLLPCLIGVLSGLGSGIRFYRTIMLDEMYRDYVRTAFAKGVSKPGVLFKHVLKNAMIPILTSVIVAIPFLYTGSLLLESFFGIPGLGNLSINALNNSDFDVIRTVVFIGSVMYILANLLTDVLYTVVDPRIRLK